MNVHKKIHLDENSVKIVYKKYKEYLIPLAVIAVCFLLFVGVIIPQIQSWLDTRSQEEEVRERIITLKSNIAFLSQQNTSVLNTQFATSSKALPFEKDYEGILSALSLAAETSGVGLGDYSFQVGVLSPQKLTEPRPTVKVQIALQGDVRSVARFIQKLSVSLPLSNVESIQQGGNFSTVSLRFYYKPISNAKFNETTVLKSLSSQDQSVLSKLSEWEKNSSLSSGL